MYMNICIQCLFIGQQHLVYEPIVEKIDLRRKYTLQVAFMPVRRSCDVSLDGACIDSNASISAA